VIQEAWIGGAIEVRCDPPHLEKVLDALNQYGTGDEWKESWCGEQQANDYLCQ
jgi:uncharacterized protein YidB (DUF937 family)